MKKKYLQNKIPKNKHFLNFTASRKRRQIIINAPHAVDLSEQKSNVIKIDPNKSKRLVTLSPQINENDEIKRSDSK